MQNSFKRIDNFAKNIIIVFAGTSLLNFFSLLYQLLIAHKLSPADFAAFNSLLSLFVVISSPLNTIQLAVAKYSAEFNAHNQINKVNFLLLDSLKKVSIAAIVTLIIFSTGAVYIINLLKITSLSCGYLLAVLLALAWITPVFLGGVQGLELFWWVSFGSVISGILKLALAFIFIILGYNIAGALGALLVSNLVTIVIFYFPLRRFINLKLEKQDTHPVTDITDQAILSNGVNYKEIFIYLFPVAISYFCFYTLVNSDMVLVKYFFNPEDSGLYSLAQMAGKIFLFLPAAVAMVMFPKTSSLNAKNIDTVSTLRRSLLYVLGLCFLSILFYNLFPVFVLKVLTGKSYPQSILLGRLFSISMSVFAILFVLISYFLSLKQLHFIKYLVFFSLLQVLTVCLFHKNLIQVQLILCLNAIVLFFIHVGLVKSKKLA